MNLRFVNCFVAVIGLVCVGVNGDVTPMPPDPPISQQAQEALDMTPFANELAKVGPEVDKLVQNSSDAATVSMVRKWLIDQDQPTATNPYQEAYAAALNQAFVKALSQPDVPINSKINFAIVIQSLAGPKENLADTVTQLVADANPVVALQGLEAARAMLPYALQTSNFNTSGQRDMLLAAIVKSVGTHPDGPLAGQVAEEAYNALNPRQWRTVSMPAGAPFSALVDANLALQKARLDFYLNKGVPPFPKGDSYPSYLLMSQPEIWRSLTTTQQLQAAQQASDLVSYLGQRFSALGPVMNTNQDIIEALKGEGEWINKLGQDLGDQNIMDVGAAVNKLSAEMPPAAIRQTCDHVFGAMQENTSFTGLIAPQTIGAAAPPAAGGAAPPTAPAAPKSASDNSAGSSPTSEARQ